MNGKFEILAPAGSFEILKSVIEAGADAVYVGGTMFGARAYANNFSEEELLQAIDYCHFRNVKLYLTVNTLMKNKEIEEDLISYLTPFYKQGLDAVIVQDIGALELIHQVFPDMELHASTQMTVHGKESALLLKELGASRIVTSREMSLKEIDAIRNALDIEIETFVHGALCYSFSGQCLFSSMLGGRSGNRGRCAQPCRLSYEVLDENKNMIEEDSYILSLKDNCAIDLLKEMDQAGVYSLKIEGRMKQAEYAAGVVSYYRKYVDRYYETHKVEVLKEDQTALLNLGNRSGFTNHYFHTNNHEKMITRIKPSHEKGDESLHSRIRKDYIDMDHLLPIDCYVEAKIGENLKITYVKDDYAITKEGAPVSLAMKRPIEKEDVEKAIGRLGDANFYVEHMDIMLDENAFLPVNAMKSLRRETLEELKKTLIGNLRREVLDFEHEIRTKSEKNINDKTSETWIVSLENRSLLKRVLKEAKVACIYLDVNAYQNISFMDELKKDVGLIKNASKKVGVMLPTLFREETSNFYTSHVAFFSDLNLDYIIVRNYEEIYWWNKFLKHIPLIVDHNVYTYNNRAESSMHNLGVSFTTIPFELNQKEIAHRNNYASEIMLYGYYPLMVTANCLVKNTKGCKKTCQTTYLRDRYRKDFPVKNYCKDCYNVIYNSLPTSLLGQINELRTMNIHRFRLHFSIENEKMVNEVFEAINQGRNVSFDTTKGHYKRGVE